MRRSSKAPVKRSLPRTSVRSAEGRIRFPAKAVLTYSPATKAHAGLGGMTLAEICEGGVALSDNTAANLMLDALGALDGPAGLTAWLRSTGDDVTRLDRTEPTLNEALLDDPRDTTSPFAMAATLNRLVLGKTLRTGNGPRPATCCRARWATGAGAAPTTGPS